jgi:hypothetical protein
MLRQRFRTRISFGLACLGTSCNVRRSAECFPSCAGLRPRRPGYPPPLISPPYFQSSVRLQRPPHLRSASCHPSPFKRAPRATSLLLDLLPFQIASSPQRNILCTEKRFPSSAAHREVQSDCRPRAVSILNLSQQTSGKRVKRDVRETSS